MKKLLTLFAFPALLCLMPLTAWTQTHTVVNVVEQTASVTRTSTLYVGEVLLDGQQSFYYLYSEDMTNSDYIFGAVRNCLSDFKDGIYSALVPIIDGTTEEIGISLCSNSDYESMMNSDWKQAEKAGLACLPNMKVTSSSSDNLYETDADFAEKCPGEFKDITLLDDVGESMAVSGIIAQLSAVNTDRVTYTVENGVLVKHIERHINFTCEMTTVIYTKVELTSGSTSSVLGDVDGDGTVSVTDVAWIVNHILGVNDNNFIIANADINGDGEIDINDVMATVSIILGDDKPQAHLTCPDNNHPHMIDLGLPSGTKWACCNVGANKPEGYGRYYAWGETEDKSVYNWSTYIHCDGSKNTCHDLGSDIAGTQYDVAHVEWKSHWQMPTRAQFDELLNNCNIQWTNLNGINGHKFTGSNNGSIFFPAAGMFKDSAPNGVGAFGYYWSSTWYGSDLDSGYACTLNFYQRGLYTSYDFRNYGKSVRPVVNP